MFQPVGDFITQTVPDFFVDTVWNGGLVPVWNWTKQAGIDVGDFFKNTVWNDWIVGGVWNTFCVDWVANTFAKEWVWETFCVKWVAQTFARDWIWNGGLVPAWNWVKNNWKESLDWFFTFAAVGSVGYGLALKLGLRAIPYVGQVLFVIDILGAIWGVLRKTGVL